MKNRPLFLLGTVALLCWTAPAAAWWQWYHYDLPYAPAQGRGAPAMWYYNYAPSGATPGAAPPGMWFYQAMPYGPTQFWSLPAISSGIYVEQLQSPTGYGYRIGSRDPGLQNIDVKVEGGALVISSRNSVHSDTGQASSFHSGWSTQWVSLPADANLARMTLSRRGNIVEIFVPRG